MSNVDNTVEISLVAELKGVAAATKDLSDLVDKATEIPQAVGVALKAASEQLDHNRIEMMEDQVSGNLPVSIQSPIAQMLGIARAYANNLHTGLQTGPSANTADLQQSSAVLNATIYTVSQTLFRLNDVFGSATRMFGNNADGLKAFGNSMVGLQRRMADIVSLHKETLQSAGMRSSAVERLLLNDRSIDEGYRNFAQTLGAQQNYATYANAFTKTALVKALIPTILPMTGSRDYWDRVAAMSGGQISNTQFVNYTRNYLDSFPEMFRGLPLDPRKMDAAQRAKQVSYGDERLTAEQWNQVRKAAATNPTFERALVQRGLAERGISNVHGHQQAGVLKMPQAPITKQQLAETLGLVA